MGTTTPPHFHSHPFPFSLLPPLQTPSLTHPKMYAGRIPAINKATAERGLKLEPKMTKEQLNSYIPIETRWKADNYNHLLEQPTNFYAVVLALQYLGVQDPLTVGLAWGECNVSFSFRLGRSDGGLCWWQELRGIVLIA